MSDRFKTDEVLTSGPTFGLNYDGGFYFNKYNDFNDQMRPPRFKPEQQVFITTTNPPTLAKILTIPSTDANIYTVQHTADLTIKQYPAQNLLEYDPIATINDTNQPSPNLPKWIKHDTKATIFLHSMKKPQKSILLFDNNQWFFRHGYKDTNPPQLLPDFPAQLPYLLSSYQLFKGHQKFTKLLHLRQSQILALAIARHISTANLTSEDLPTLSKLKDLPESDRITWTDSYWEEYKGLIDLPTWEVISEEEYEAIRHLCP